MINTTNTITSFLIIDAVDSSKILFSTMGGYQFYPHSESNGEWQRRMEFRTRKEAEDLIDEIYASKRLLDKELVVLRVSETTTKEYEQFYSHIQPDSLAAMKLLRMQEKFEKYMSENSSWQISSLMKERTKDSYKNTGLARAFDVFVQLNKTILE